MKIQASVSPCWALKRYRPHCDISYYSFPNVLEIENKMVSYAFWIRWDLNIKALWQRTFRVRVISWQQPHTFTWSFNGISFAMKLWCQGFIWFKRHIKLFYFQSPKQSEKYNRRCRGETEPSSSSSNHWDLVQRKALTQSCWHTLKA